MSVTIYEVIKSQSATVTQEGSKDDGDLHWRITGTNDYATAKALAELTAPDIWDLKTLQAVTVEPFEGAVDVWDVSAKYSLKEPKPPGTINVSFDTGGGTAHITQSLDTKDADGGAVGDNKGAIGVTKDNIEGCDITVPQFSWSEVAIIDDADVTDSQVASYYDCTGKTNDSSFRGFDTGEVLFLGASGSKRDKNAWEVTFKFAASKNKTAIAVGDLHVDKKGWEYLWVRYNDVEDTTNHRLTKQPVAAYVEKVYDEADFNDLGIGTDSLFP